MAVTPDWATNPAHAAGQAPSIEPAAQTTAHVVLSDADERSIVPQSGETDLGEPHHEQTPPVQDSAAEAVQERIEVIHDEAEGRWAGDDHARGAQSGVGGQVCTATG